MTLITKSVFIVKKLEEITWKIKKRCKSNFQQISTMCDMKHTT